jgi:hypothetical protein
VKYLAVAIAGFVLGGWSVPLGFALGMGPIAIFVSAAVGGLIGCWVFLLAGDSIEAFLSKRKKTSEARAALGNDGDSERVESVDDTTESEASAGKVSGFVDRFGVRGLGLIGPLFPGVTVSVVGGLALGLDRSQLGKWLSIGIVVMYGLYTIGLWLLVELF